MKRTLLALVLLAGCATLPPSSPQAVTAKDVGVYASIAIDKQAEAVMKCPCCKVDSELKIMISGSSTSGRDLGLGAGAATLGASGSASCSADGSYTLKMSSAPAEGAVCNQGRR